MNAKTRSKNPRHSALGALRAYNRNMEHVNTLDLFDSNCLKAAVAAQAQRVHGG
jgi:hypothetical protein